MCFDSYIYGRLGLESCREGMSFCVCAVLDGVKYATSHEWVKHEGSVATVGITDHAQVCSSPFFSRSHFSCWMEGVFNWFQMVISIFYCVETCVNSRLMD